MRKFIIKALKQITLPVTPESFEVSYGRCTETVTQLNQDRQNAYGEGYNAERMKGLEAEKNFMTGDDLENANEVDKAIGAYYASLDNKRDELRRKAEKEAYAQIDRDGLARDGAEAGRVLMEFRAKAEAQYNAYKEVQREAGIQAVLLNDVGQMLMDDEENTYWENRDSINQARAKGREAARKATQLAFQQDAGSRLHDAVLRDEGGALPPDEVREMYPHSFRGLDDQFDYNLYLKMREETIANNDLMHEPYKNPFAMLRESAEIWMSSAAHTWNNTVPVTLTGNNFYIREEADIYKIAQEIARDFLNAAILS